MKAIVLAAGKGTRMRPLSESAPKPMLPVAGRPLVAHTLDAAVEAGAEELVIVVGYESEAIRDHVGSTYRDTPVTYVIQERQLGTAHAVSAARSDVDATFAVLNGDNLHDPACISRLLEAGPSVAVFESDSPSNFGVVNLEDGYVSSIVEKPTDPPTNLVNAGAYVFPAEARDWLDVPESKRGEHEITDVLDRVIDEFNVRAVTANRWLDVGRPWELLSANEWQLADLDSKSAGQVSPRARLEGPVVVEEEATILPGTVIEGPVLVRAGATVGPNAYLRGATLVGPDAHVGHAVEVKNSVIMAGASVGHLSYVGDSILGRDVNLGAGTTVANLRHDDRPVELTVNGERISTGRTKFGVVVGDGVHTGINTSLNAGVTLSTGATTAPGETVTRDR